MEHVDKYMINVITSIIMVNKTICGELLLISGGFQVSMSLLEAFPGMNGVSIFLLVKAFPGINGVYPNSAL